MRRVAITGATGLIGRALTKALRHEGTEVLTVGRDERADVRWNPAIGRIEPARLEGLDAVVHLAGAPIAQRWTRKRRQEILDSRVQSTTLIASTLARLRKPPRVLVSASAVGYYGTRGDEILTERSARGSGFLADVVGRWEGATRAAEGAGIRVVHMRTGLVLSGRGGAMRKMLPAFRAGVGGPIGDGHQWMSWIGLTDLTSAIAFLMQSAVAGPCNLLSSTPVRNSEFARTLGKVLHRPAAIRVPAVVLRAVFGEMANETILTSQRAIPARLEDAGFRFAHAELEGALRHELGPGQV